MDGEPDFDLVTIGKESHNVQLQKLAKYWDTVADRLFKIRHCMNIEGVRCQLALFEPPIDPALLVRARAAGLSIGDAIKNLSLPASNYRFNTLLNFAMRIKHPRIIAKNNYETADERYSIT